MEWDAESWFLDFCFDEEQLLNLRRRISMNDPKT